MDLSFQEKSVWASLIGLIAVFGFHFNNSFGNLELTAQQMLVRLIWVIASLVIIEIISHIIIAVTSIKDAQAGATPDERDTLISIKAGRNAYYLLTICVLGLIIHWVVYELIETSDVVITSTYHANMLLLALVIAEIMNYGSRIYYYRRGI